VPADDHLIGACAMIRPDNAFENLIRVTADLRARGLPASCLVIGDEPPGQADGASARLRALAGDLGLAQCVHFLGHRQDVPELLDALDVAAVVSRHTAQSRVGPEAAARGRPVVGFDVGALSETVRHDETGLLVEPDNLQAFAGAIEGLLRDRHERDRLGAAAARHARLNFRKALKMEQTLAAYRQAMARRAPAGALPESALGVHPLSIVQMD
jgi:glycosyltransferase involved in cell wall biosynthesis